MPLSTSSRLRQGLTHVTDTGRCPTPCPNPTEVVQLGRLILCCFRSGASPSSQACLVLFPALWLSRTVVCAATELSVHCSQDLSDLQTVSVPSPNRQGELVVTWPHRVRTRGLVIGCLQPSCSSAFFKSASVTEATATVSHLKLFLHLQLCQSHGCSFL